MYKIYIVYHHDDPDGHYAGAIMRNHLLNSIKDHFREDKAVVITVPSNYSDEFDLYTLDKIKKYVQSNRGNDSNAYKFLSGISDDDKYVIKVSLVDLSFTDSTMYKIVDMVNAAYNVDEVVWIDHHISSKNTIKNVAKEFTESGIDFSIVFDTDACGAALTYAYVDTCKRYGYTTMSMHKTVFGSCVNHSNNTVGMDIRLSQNGEYYSNVNLPKALVLLDAYDRWTKKHSDANAFITGLKLEGYLLTDDNPLYKDDQSFLGDTFTNFSIANGKLVLKYQMNVYEEQADRIGFWKIGGFMVAYKNGLGNSWNFNDLLNEDPFTGNGVHYAILGAYLPTVNRWQYSIYRNSNINNDTVRCDLMANQFGGGGHPGAAGFTIDDCLFNYDTDGINEFIANNAIDPIVFGIFPNKNVRSDILNHSDKEVETEKSSELLDKICFCGSMYCRRGGNIGYAPQNKIFDAVVQNVKKSMYYFPSTFDGEEYGPAMTTVDYSEFRRVKENCKHLLYIFFPRDDSNAEFGEFIKSLHDLTRIKENGQTLNAIFVLNANNMKWDDIDIEYIDYLIDQYPDIVSTTKYINELIFELGTIFERTFGK